MFSDYLAYTNPLLKVFEHHIQEPPGSGLLLFPALFIDGKIIRIAGADSITWQECREYLRNLLYNDYIEPKAKLLTQECEYRKMGIFRKKVLVCGNANMREEDEK